MIFVIHIGRKCKEGPVDDHGSPLPTIILIIPSEWDPRWECSSNMQAEFALYRPECSAVNYAKQK